MRFEDREAIEASEKYGPLYEADLGDSSKMGVRLENDGCNIAVWAGTADVVDICTYDTADHNKVRERWRLNNNEEDHSGIFCGFIPDMRVGDIYGLRVHGDWDPANQKTYNYNKLLIDPYARAITGSFQATIDGVQNYHIGEPVNQYGDYVDYNNEDDSAPYIPRCVVVDESYDWGDDQRPCIPKSEVVLYEGHVKGMTYLRNDISEEQRGKYSGIASEAFTGYLKELGITSLEVMPVQQFVSEPHLQSKNLTNYWGYNTLGFFAPHAEYSSSNQLGGQVKEFKDMVKHLHEANIEVIMDVVYNHTPEGSEGGPTLSFKGLGGDELYHFGPDNKHSNYSGCGNTINASSDAGLNFILESLHYWAQDMHVDGFRFDLAPILAREQPYGNVNINGRFMESIQNDPILNKLKIIAEPWDCSDYKLGSFSDIWNEWNDQFRDCMRDFWRGEGNLGDFASKMAGSFSADRTINFITAHDGFTLNDLVSYNDKHNLDNGENSNDGSNNNRSYNFGYEGPTDSEEIKNRRMQVMRSMLLSMFVAAGTPMLSHGDEMMRTQNGNNNAYCQDNETSWVDWDMSAEQKQFFEYVASIIYFRKTHPVFSNLFNCTGRPVVESSGEADLAWFRSDGYQFEFNDEAWRRKKVIGMYMSGIALGKTIQTGTITNGHSFLYYANGTYEDQEIDLPKLRPYAGDYEIVIDTTTCEISNGENGIQVEMDKFVIKALSAVILKRTTSRL
jgi:glycogen operon protein